MVVVTTYNNNNRDRVYFVLFFHICFFGSYCASIVCNAPEVLIYPEVIPGPRYRKKAMAGDTSTELLFLDTFKHQSAEVVFPKSFHSIVY